LRRTKGSNRIVLAYSGSANTTVAIPWLAERYEAEVVTVTLDLDQRTGLEATRDRALAAGAVRAHVVDACDEFARDFIVPALRAGAVTSEGDMLVAALTRPLIAKHLVNIARIEDAAAVAHGSAEDRARCFESLIRDLDPSLVVLSPACEWTFAPADLIAYARARNLSVRPADASAAMRSTSTTPDYPATVDVAFEEGVPVALNGVSLPILELISSVETLAGAHGVGLPAPATRLLHEAHRALQSCVTPPDIDRSARERGADYAGLVTAGAWYSPARKDGDAFVASVQKHVTGTARLKLFRGHSEVVECRSPFARS
jgi:argininosuccinate synthase